MSTAVGTPAQRTTAYVVIGIASVVLVVVCLFPFAWMALSSIKKVNELYTVPPVWLPNEPTEMITELRKYFGMLLLKSTVQ